MILLIFFTSIYWIINTIYIHIFTLNLKEKLQFSTEDNVFKKAII